MGFSQENLVTAFLSTFFLSSSSFFSIFAFLPHRRPPPQDFFFVYVFFHLLFDRAFFKGRRRILLHRPAKASVSFTLISFSTIFACRNVRTRGRRAAAPAQEGAVVGACGGTSYLC
jgi:hypothetical protein